MLLIVVDQFNLKKIKICSLQYNLELIREHIIVPNVMKRFSSYYLVMINVYLIPKIFF